MPVEATGRRPFLKVLAVGAATLGGVTAASRLWLHPDSPAERRGPLMQLTSSGDTDVQSLALRLGEEVLPQIGVSEWRSRQLPTSTHSMVAFTWRRSTREPVVQISSRAHGRWETWRTVPALHDVPNVGSKEDHGVDGTELVWIGDADGIQIRVAGRLPDGLTLVLLNPSRRDEDLGLELAQQPPINRMARTTEVPPPAILSRQAWGADESWRSGQPRYNSILQQVHVHHTAGSNTYTRADVPAIMRGIYHYHTKNLGWSDIAYNFLVDKFGRIWTGRAGEVTKLVRGAHTLGFNGTSVGVAVIGNLELVTPTPAVLDAVAQVAAWKLGAYGVDPIGRATVTSEGSDRYRLAATAALPVIDGHRDTNDTSCPGRHLYASLPAIRTKARALVDAAQREPVKVLQASLLSGAPLVGEPLTLTPGTYSPIGATASISWLRNGATVATGTSTYTPVAADLGAVLTVTVVVSSPGFLDVTENVSTAKPVRHRSVTTARTRGRKGRAVVHVSVADAAGVPATGKVTVKVSGRRLVVALDGGRSRVLIRGLAAGRHDVTAIYNGSRTTQRSEAAGQVRVR